MKSIALIMPYYGTYPNYFSLWLKTANYNDSIDFYIITDIVAHSTNFPRNVHVVSMSFDDIRKRVQSLFDFEVKLSTPYKLCDYKPLYGLVFCDIIAGFDFWGHCDPDIIWGDIRKYITDEMLECNEKIYSRGHLTLYRNTDFINKVCLKRHSLNVYTYEEAFATDYICNFDEWGGVSKLFANMGIVCYDEIDFADIRYQNFNFEFAKPIGKDGKLKAFYWKDGKLYGYILDGVHLHRKEFIYIHLQKRRMDMNIGKDTSSFAIVPNTFIDYSSEDITIDFIIRNCKKRKIYSEYIKLRVKMIIDRIKLGAIKQRYLRLKKRYLGVICRRYVKK